MCCAVSLVCPSNETHRTCQFWKLSDPVNMPKTIESPAKCGVRAEIRFPYSEQATRNVFLRYCPCSWQCSAAHCSCNKEASWSVFDGKCLVTHHHPPQTWLPVIFISFLVWNSRRRTTFWQSELEIGVENWLNVQAAGFYDEGIGKLAPRCENVYVGASTM